MQDGKVDELMRHENKQRKLLQKNQSKMHAEDEKKVEKDEEILEQGPSDNDRLKEKSDQ